MNYIYPGSAPHIRSKKTGDYNFKDPIEVTIAACNIFVQWTATKGSTGKFSKAAYAMNHNLVGTPDLDELHR